MGIHSIMVCNVLCVCFVYMCKISLCAHMCQGINQALTVLRLELSLGTNQLIFFSILAFQHLPLVQYSEGQNVLTVRSTQSFPMYISDWIPYSMLNGI